MNHIEQPSLPDTTLHQAAKLAHPSSQDIHQLLCQIQQQLHLQNHALQPQSQPQPDDDGSFDLASCLDLLFDHRWLIMAIALAVTLLGTAYAFLAKPIYEANVLIQVEDSPGSSKNILGEMASMFDVKTASTAEMEILRSRRIVSHATDRLSIHIDARPKYFPVIGAWIASRKKALSTPGLLGFGGYAWGAEKIEVRAFEVPEGLEGKEFTLTALGDGQYRLQQANIDVDLFGSVGQRLTAVTEEGRFDLTVESLAAEPGANFILRRDNRLETIQKLQRSLAIAEKGKQSGIIGVVLQHPDPVLARNVLNEIGNEYVRQNVERKSEEAEKTLLFLDKQLPQLKRELEEAENKFNAFRNRMGTVDLGEEGKLALKQSIDTQTRLLELKQKRGELLTRQQVTHPDVIAIDNLIKNLNGEISLLTSKIKKLPLLEQEVLRLTRDVKVNTDLYTALLNSAQQLRLVRAGKVGNVRMVDTAVVEKEPVKPMKAMVVGLTLLAGLFLGVVAAFVKKSLFGGIESAHEIEEAGYSVYATVPHSQKQNDLVAGIKSKVGRPSILATLDPHDPAIESLRSFRTTLQFSALDAKNNVILIVGATPGLGKSFTAVNLAAVMGLVGKKVLLIDADLRKGHLHQYFGLGRGNGLSELVLGSPVDKAVRKDVAENVDFIPTGDLPPNPAEILAHARVADILGRLSMEYDFVLVDTAPVLVVADTLSLAPHAGNVFLVARAGASTIGEIKESMRKLSQAGVYANGILLNDMKSRPGRYGYGSKYGRYRYTQYRY